MYISIPRNSDDFDAYSIDTLAEIEIAQAAMLEADMTEAPVYAGAPDCPDSYANGQTLFARDVPGFDAVVGPVVPGRP